MFMVGHWGLGIGTVGPGSLGVGGWELRLSPFVVDLSDTRLLFPPALFSRFLFLPHDRLPFASSLPVPLSSCQIPWAV